LAHLLVGSEGTLAFSTRIHLKLSPLPRHKVMGICHFPSFRAAMEAAAPIVELKPSAVELMDATMLALARDIAMFRPVVERFVKGDPQALLMVEFAGDDEADNLRSLRSLAELIGDLGYAWEGGAKGTGGVIEIAEPALIAGVNDVRSSGLNIMMSMKSEGKPVSFIEDCAVPLADLPDYTERLTEVFARHGTTGTWYAHASVGCLHVRPVLNLKLDKDVTAMRAIAEEAFAMVREYKGSHSGEHGDGLVRSEFHEAMFGARMVATFTAVKDRFDPRGVLNPGKIVRPSKMDDRSLFRYPPGYGVGEMATALDWRGFSGAGGGFQGAVEMCNNNGACRKFDAGVMCPSFRVTGNERDLTRGRANSLRLAISGQLGADALASDAMAETMALCVSCKACRRECPTGVDMARMKIEVLAARARTRRLSVRDRLVAFLPRYARYASAMRGLMNLRNTVPALAWAMERTVGIAAKRSLPEWRKPFDTRPRAVGPEGGRAVVLLADTFNTRFEPENLDAALAVLTAAGCRVHIVGAADGGRPLCCGRTFLSAGLVEEAKAEARRTMAALMPFVDQGAAVVGLEPSCLLTLRDEYLAMGLGADSERLAARAMLFEEFLATEADAGRLALDLKALPASRALLHGHCHQKAFAAMGAVERALKLVPGLEVETVQSSCCGMAGAFGYQAETYDTSQAMGELSLLPIMRAAPADAIIVADGTSCRHQIADGTGRRARHVAVVLREALR
jgi:Fe-S oxidoreductase